MCGVTCGLSSRDRFTLSLTKTPNLRQPTRATPRTRRQTHQSPPKPLRLSWAFWGVLQQFSVSWLQCSHTHTHTHARTHVLTHSNTHTLSSPPTAVLYVFFVRSRQRSFRKNVLRNEGGPATATSPGPIYTNPVYAGDDDPAPPKMLQPWKLDETSDA